jgi:hypothetical protein
MHVNFINNVGEESITFTLRVDFKLCVRIMFKASDFLLIR